MPDHDLLAAVDLGTNSFRLEIARVVDDQLYPLDTLRESVRLGAGLTADKRLDADAQDRALACLARFAERLRGMPAGAVRAVGTSALRVARNSAEFLREAEAALGFPIDVVAGREEARLIYLGVARGLPASQSRRLVVDIGGGSTEVILGQGLSPYQMESLRLGFVDFSRRFFPDGRIEKAAWQAAEVAARRELEAVARWFSPSLWDEAVGSSGTARALAAAQEENGLGEAGITADGLAALRAVLIKAGHCDALELKSLKAERRPVFAAGCVIMAAVFAEVGITRMTAAQTAMREGILHDLLGRVTRHDQRELTVVQFMRRAQADEAQAGRVEALALALFAELAPGAAGLACELGWAARLHEIGLVVAHAGLHRHGAYILENADMPGFSRGEQVRLALLVRASRGGLAKVTGLPAAAPDLRAAVLALRLAVLFHRSRRDAALPALALRAVPGGFALHLPSGWLADNPLTDAALADEREEWAGLGVGLEVAGG